MSRLSRQVEKIVNPNMLHERIMELYQEETGRIIGHLSIDSTVIEARESPSEVSEPPGNKRNLRSADERRKDLPRRPNTKLARLRKSCNWPNTWLNHLKSHFQRLRSDAPLPQSRTPRAKDNGSSAIKPIWLVMILECQLPLPLLEPVYMIPRQPYR